MKSFISCFYAVILGLLLAASPAWADLSLQAAKTQGLVGERPDGLVGAVQASSEVDAVVNATNQERLAKYNEIASKNGTDLKKVQALAGEKLINQAPSGAYVFVGGSWNKK